MKAQIIIIGGGVIGTACAYFLSRRGAKVLVLERGHLGCGASGATAAIISIGGTGTIPEPLCRLNIESYNLVLDLEEDFDQPLEIMRGGILYVALNEHQAAEIRPIYEGIRRLGIECRLLDGPEARRLEPMLGPGVTAAVYNPASYHVNPFRLSEAYLRATLRRGGEIQYGIEVFDVKVNNGRIERVVTDRGDYYADWVIVAGGAHTPQILSSLGIEIPILPARGQVIITEAYPRMTEHVLMFMDHLYVEQTANGNFYLGSHTEFAGFENRITLEKLTTYAQAFVRAVPILARLQALRFFAAFRPVCEDGLPVIGPVPGCPRLIIASGHGRVGVRLSAGTGKAVSEIIVDGETEHPIDAFDVDRFVGTHLS